MQVLTETAALGCSAYFPGRLSCLVVALVTLIFFFIAGQLYSRWRATGL